MKKTKIIRKVFQLVLLMFLITNIYGQSGFSDPVLINSQICPTSVYACDFDNDTDNDVISTSYWDGIIYWHENLDGSGNFGTPQLITNIAEGANSVYACDIDGDGDNDVLSASWLDNKIAWYENVDGAGSFGPQQIITSSAIEAHRVYACDIDGDGDNDVLSASYGDNKIAWYKNLDGNGNFGDQIIITNSAINALSVYACDIDGDGDNDVLSASGDNKIALYVNTDGNGNFADQYVISTSVDRPFCVYACDIDNDGDNDVLSASENDDKIAWYENIDGRGHFGPQQIISLEADGAEIVYACDIDNDGDNDVLSACYWGNKIALYENIDAKGNFSEEIVISNTAYGIFSVYAADLNGDEKIDVLSASAVGDKIEWHTNNKVSSQFDFFLNEKNLIYPNPTNGVVNLDFQNFQQIKKIEIIDINGKIIHEKSVVRPKDSFDLSKNKNGIYVMKIYIDNKEFSYKIIKE